MAVGVAAEVKSKLSVVDVVQDTVQLKKSGSTYKGLCPFHGEKTPSFYVTPARESWKCFGCGLGGDIFSFVMQRDSVSFPEALKVLAARAGVELDERTSRQDARNRRLREVLEGAIAFYHSVLTSHPSGEPALAYLKGRGFTETTIQVFQLGWAPGGWETTSKQLIAKRGATPEELAAVGLTTPRGTGRGGAYDRFRERIIFPIRDMNGNAVGLGGRYLIAEGDTRDHGPKYLNSPATALFDKSRTLYLVDKAKGSIRKSGQAVIVEGYTDALMAHQAGFDNVVASLGTALTPGQVALLTRYARKVALAYDVDPAGQSAGSFGVTELNNLISEVQAEGGVGLTDVGVVRLPEGKDPDEVIRESPDTWREAVRTPDPILAYLIDYHASRVDVRTPEGRKRLVDAVLPTLRKVGDPTIRDTYLQLLARRSTVSEETLLETLHRRPDSVGRSVRPAGAGRRSVATMPAPGSRSTRSARRPSRSAPRRSSSRSARSRSSCSGSSCSCPTSRRGSRTCSSPTSCRRPWPGSCTPRSSRTGAGERRPPATPTAQAASSGAGSSSRSTRKPGRSRSGCTPSTGRTRATYPRSASSTTWTSASSTLEADGLEERSDWNQAEQAEAELHDDHEAMARLLTEEAQINEARRSLDRRIEQTRLLTRPTTAAAPRRPADLDPRRALNSWHRTCWTSSSSKRCSPPGRAGRRPRSRRLGWPRSARASSTHPSPTPRWRSSSTMTTTRTSRLISSSARRPRG